LIISMLFIASGLMAQPSLDTLISYIETNNPTLKAAQSLLETQKLDARTGLAPSNPEVEFGYMWGNPTELGTRVDFSVMQTIDFPTAYVSRSKLSKISQTQADLQFLAGHQEILLQAHKVWISRVYLNKMESLLSGRLEYAYSVYKGFERKWQTGESDQLQLNQSRLKVSTLENEFNQLKREFSKNDADLKNLIANQLIEINDTVFPASFPIVFDSLLVQYQAGYINQIYQTEIERKDKEADVIFHQKLPKLKAGYYSESILDTKMQGVKAGITIPLWGDARAVRTAEAGLIHAEDDANMYWQYKYNELKQIYEELQFLKDRVEDLEAMLEISNDEVLLRKAMEAGEISLTEYFYESDFYFQNIKDLLEYQKEMLLLEAELRKVYF